MRSALSRRAVLRGLLGGAVASVASVSRAASRGDPLRPAREVVARPGRLRQHFVFDYYPWFSSYPDFRHWTKWDRRPPHEVASAFMPALGAYDSRSAAVIEQHARWIVESGAGAVALSWWGPGSYEDQAVDLVMDVFHDHGLAVGFGLEPYRHDRGSRFAEDVTYLVRRYGERRGYDAFHLLTDEDGSVGPVFKGFRCIVPESTVDCHGRTVYASDYTPDNTWHRQIDAIRSTFRHDFDHLIILADSLDFGRTPAAGFDGIAIYDNFVLPEFYRPLAEAASQVGLSFSFNANPGYDQIEPRDEPVPEPGDAEDDCYAPRPVTPVEARVDWRSADQRELASLACARRIRESFAAALDVQTDIRLTNARCGFFLVYLNSFNEWHEGHAFEPMRDAALLSADERLFAYHNPARGDYRLRTLASLIDEALRGTMEPVALETGRPTIPGYAARSLERT